MRSGKKTEEEILTEFLDTFEMHSNMSKPSGGDHRITWEEFCEYYNNISINFDNDEHFQLMITNAWKLDGSGPAKQGWGGEF